MDTILKNGKIYLCEGRFAPCLLMGGGLVKAVGTWEELSALSPEAEVIDLAGRTVIPGLIDSHLHLLGLGTMLRSVQLYGATSVRECIERGRAFLAAHDLGPDEIVEGRGWNDDYFTDEHRMLDCRDLDQISAERPIVFARACGHALVANTAAMRLAGVTEKTPQVAGGRFELGPDGKPNGVFRENAMDLIRAIAPAPSVEQLKERLRAAMAYAAQYGITSIQTNDMQEGNWPDVYRAYEELKNEGSATLRVYQQCFFSSVEGYEAFLAQGWRTGKGDDMHKIGPLKLFVDGSLGARTALLRAPYADAPETAGLQCVSEEDLRRFAELSAENGMQMVVHAIGDRGIELVLDAYEGAFPAHNPMRCGIVHCQITDEALLRRFAARNVCALVQPIFLHYDMHIAASRVGEALAATSYAFGTMDRLGIHNSYGTDSPVEDPNTMQNIYCAVTRRDLTGYPEGGWLPGEAVGVARAVDHYTVDGAYNSFDEGRKGRLLPGFFADLAVLDRDIFTVPAEELREAKVEMTLLGGKVVFRR